MKSIIGILIVLLTVAFVPHNSHAQAGPASQPDTATMARWQQQFENSRQTYIDPGIVQSLDLASAAGTPTSMDLIGYLNYVAADRNSGPTCANSWVWAGTGVLEILESINYGSAYQHRRSVQFMNSCYPSYPCHYPGDIDDFVNWYTPRTFTIPWTNTNAGWADGTQACGQQSTSCVSCSSIATSPNYPFNVNAWTTVTTFNAGQSKAIKNIKATLQRNQPIYVKICYPNPNSYTSFQTFWNTNNNDWMFDPTFSINCGLAMIEGSAGCHSGVIVGYNDDDPDPINHYWTILNSWGIGVNRNRLDGTWHMPVNINYNCDMALDYSGKKYPIVSFYTMELNTPTVYVKVSGAGRITSTPSGINCGNSYTNCTRNFGWNSGVTLTANYSATATVFKGWKQDCSGSQNSPTCTIIMDKVKNVEAEFVPAAKLTISKKGSGTGTVTTSPTGIDCGATCSAIYEQNTVVTLTPTADSNSTFTGWSGGGCSGTGTCTVTMNSAKTIAATFAPSSAQSVLTITKSGVLDTCLTLSPSGTKCGPCTGTGVKTWGACSQVFATGTTVNASYTVNGRGTGSTFTGCDTVTGLPTSGYTCAVTMNSSRTVNFDFHVAGQ